jgi:hypothetical protein
VQDRQSAGSLFTIHGMPKRSVTMPKPGDQKVFSYGIVTVPPWASALKIRCPSATARLIET